MTIQPITRPHRRAPACQATTRRMRRPSARMPTYYHRQARALHILTILWRVSLDQAAAWYCQRGLAAKYATTHAHERS